MRILILVDCYFPTTKSAAQLVHDLGVELVAQGHEVTVLAPWESAAAEVAVSWNEGVRIVRIRTGRLKGASRILRGLRETFLGSVLWHKGKQFFRENPCDLIVFYSPSIFFGRLVARLKDLWACPAYLILRDIWPQFLVDTGVLGHGPVYHFFRRKEIQQNDAADVIGVQSSGDLEYFPRSFPRKRYQVEVLHNWAALQAPAPAAGDYRRRWGLENKTVFFYGGNLGIAQDLDNLLRLAGRLQDRPEVMFLFVGGGSEAARLQDSITRARLANVQVRPAVPQAEYLQILSACCDVGLISLDKRFRIQNIPGKLMGYLFCSVPVLASVNPGNDLLHLIPEVEAGFCCVNGDDEQLAHCAVRLAEDPALRTRMGGHGRRLLEERFAVAGAARQISRIGKNIAPRPFG